VIQRVRGENAGHFDRDTHEDAKEEAYKKKKYRPAALKALFQELGVPADNKLVLSYSRDNADGKGSFFILVFAYDAATDTVIYITAYFSHQRARNGELRSTYYQVDRRLFY